MAVRDLAIALEPRDSFRELLESVRDSVDFVWCDSVGVSINRISKS